MRSIVISAFFCYTFLGMNHAASADESATARPNVVFVLVDDLGWSDVGYQHAETPYETPNVDQLATQGMVFTDFYSAGPVCSPTRASIMTGKDPARLGITRWLHSPDHDPAHVKHHLELDEETVAEAFREHGYATGYFGKWHLGYKSQHWALHQGFAVAKGGIDLPWAWQLCYPDRTPPTAETWRNGHKRFFSPYHLTHLENGPDGEYLTERLTNETIRFIETHRDQPFFVFLSFHTVHTPLEAKPEIVEKYRKKIRDLGLDQKQGRNRGEKRYQNNPNYAAMVHHMDENVGRLLKRIDELRLSKNSIVIFTSDNGGKGSVTSNLPLRGMKHNLYEGGIRVPTIIRWPGKIAAGKRCSQPLISNDFYPTLLELTGLPLKPEQHLDAISFKPILLGERARIDRETMFWHYPHSRMEGAVRQGKWKLLLRYKTGKHELYNLRRDPGEHQNLVAEEPERVSTLEAEHRMWRKRVGARFPKNLP